MGPKLLTLLLQPLIVLELQAGAAILGNTELFNTGYIVLYKNVGVFTGD